MPLRFGGFDRHTIADSTPRLRRLSLIIVGAYILIAALWLIGAHRWTQEQLTQYRVVKDTLFILITGAVQYFVIYLTMNKIHHARRALEAERELRQSNEYSRSVVDSSPVAIMSVNADGIIQTWNRAAEQLFGWTALETQGAPDPTIPPAQAEEARLHRQFVLRGESIRDIEVRRVTKDATTIDIALSAAPVHGTDGQITSAIFFCTDITERKQQAEKVHHLATHDPLTNLPNRRILEDHLERVVERSRRGQPAALLMLDLDSFKLINDELGHLLGDQYLIHLARVLEGTLRAGDVLTRFGGDEFAMLLENITPTDAQQIAERVQAAVANYRFYHGDRSYDTSVSIGVATISRDSDSQSVMVMADTALLIAKDEGRNRVVMYESKSRVFSKLTESSRWAQRVKDALRDDRFVLYYQPVVNLATGKPEHYEVLLRMRGLDGKIISPNAFIHAAEQFGLMPRIDRWVVDNVIESIRVHPGAKIFVNLSGTSLTERALLESIEQRVKESDLRGRLVFEITETAAVTDLHHAQQWMSRLSQLGVEFALDDFGAAFSSFTYLRELPVQYVKLDGSFVRKLDKDKYDRAMVQALNTIAHSLGKKVIAEWVENAAVASALKEIGIEYGQGYFFGRPVETPYGGTLAA